MTRILLPVLLTMCACSCREKIDPPPDRASGKVLYLVPIGTDLDPATVGADLIARVELALDSAARSRGLMECTGLADDSGMLFVYPYEAERSFWMKNVPIPLSIAFATSTGRIVRILEMASGAGVPEGRLEHYPSGESVTYALEMAAGWFETKGVRVGDRISLHPEIAAEEVR